MGMFDTIFVAQNLINNLIKDSDVTLECFDGYYNFQTKDLDNCLTDFYIEEDSSFKWQKQEYEIPKEDNSVKNPSSRFTDWVKPVGDPKMVEDTRTAYFDFYDFFLTDDERVFVTFTAHVKNGKLVEPITVKEITRDNLKEEQEKHKKLKEQWTKTTTTWEWRVATLIFEIRWRIKRTFLPFFNFFDKIEKNLRDKARSKCTNV